MLIQIIFIFFGIFFIINVQAAGLDKTFGNNGLVISNINNSDDRGYALKLQPDSKLVVTASSYVGDRDYALLRYESNGSLDVNFANSGINVQNINGSDNPSDVLLLDNGKIVVVGTSGDSTNEDFTLMRYDNNGSVDLNYGNNGVVITDINGHDYATAGALQSDGKIIVGGYDGGNFLLARYEENGTLDSSFNGNGTIIQDLLTNDAELTDILVNEDGKIFVAGSADNGSYYDVVLVCFNPDGTLNTTFGTNGVVKTNLNKSATIESIIIQNDGKILALGSYYTNEKETNVSYSILIIRYEIDGTLDTTFGVNGVVIENIGTESDYGKILMLQEKGQIIAAGESYYYDSKTDEGANRFFIMSFNTNGSIDRNFGTNGAVVTETQSDSSGLHDAVLDSDGYVTIVGHTYRDSGAVIIMQRYDKLENQYNDILNPAIIMYLLN